MSGHKIQIPPVKSFHSEWLEKEGWDQYRPFFDEKTKLPVYELSMTQVDFLGLYSPSFFENIIKDITEVLSNLSVNSQLNKVDDMSAGFFYLSERLSALIQLIEHEKTVTVTMDQTVVLNKMAKIIGLIKEQENLRSDLTDVIHTVSEYSAAILYQLINSAEHVVDLDKAQSYLSSIYISFPNIEGELRALTFALIAKTSPEKLTNLITDLLRESLVYDKPEAARRLFHTTVMVLDSQIAQQCISQMLEHVISQDVVRKDWFRRLNFLVRQFGLNASEDEVIDWQGATALLLAKIRLSEIPEGEVTELLGSLGTRPPVEMSGDAAVTVIMQAQKEVIIESQLEKAILRFQLERALECLLSQSAESLKLDEKLGLVSALLKCLDATIGASEQLTTLIQRSIVHIFDPIRHHDKAAFAALDFDYIELINSVLTALTKTANTELLTEIAPFIKSVVQKVGLDSALVEKTIIHMKGAKNIQDWCNWFEIAKNTLNMDLFVEFVDTIAVGGVGPLKEAYKAILLERDHKEHVESINRAFATLTSFYASQKVDKAKLELILISPALMNNFKVLIRRKPEIGIEIKHFYQAAGAKVNPVDHDVPLNFDFFGPSVEPPKLRVEGPVQAPAVRAPLAPFATAQADASDEASAAISEQKVSKKRGRGDESPKANNKAPLKRQYTGMGEEDVDTPAL